MDLPVFSLEVIHIIFAAQADEQIEAGAPLHLVFLFTGKGQVLSVEVLRQKGNLFLNGYTIPNNRQMQLRSRITA